MLTLQNEEIDTERGLAFYNNVKRPAPRLSLRKDHGVFSTDSIKDFMTLLIFPISHEFQLLILYQQFYYN